MRRFEYTDATSSKFWEVELTDTNLNVRWGKIGTAGQSQTKSFADAAKAGTAMLKLIAEKTTKGYIEVAGVSAAIADSASKSAVKSLAEANPRDPNSANSANSAKIAMPLQESMQVAAEDETPDQVIERVFIRVCKQIAAGELGRQEGPLTTAKIRRLEGVSETQACEVINQLVKSGLIVHWNNLLDDDAQSTAQQLLADVSEFSSTQDTNARKSAITSAGMENSTAVEQPPWLAQGEPLSIGIGLKAQMHNQARPTRRNPKTLGALDLQQAWMSLRELIFNNLQPDIAASDARLRGDFSAACSVIESADGDGSLPALAVLLALSLHRESFYTRGHDTLLVDYLVARHGLEQAVEALLAAQRIEIVEQYVSNGKNTVSLHIQVTKTLANRYDIVSDGEWRFRAHLAAASQTVYAACAAKIRQAVPQLPLLRQPLLALLLPDEADFSNELVHALCAPAVDTPYTVHWLQLTASEPAALRLAAQVKCDVSFWGREDLVCTILLEHGVNAVQWLAPGAVHTAAGDALACIGTPEALDALARAASSSKAALARFAFAAIRWPAASVVVLARLLGGNSKDVSLLTPTLIQLLRTHPDLVSQLRPWLEPASLLVIDKLLGRLTGPLEIAPIEELPEVLAKAPWQRAKKKLPPIVELAVLALPPCEFWNVGDKEALCSLHSWDVSRLAQAEADPNVMVQVLGCRGVAPTPAHNRASSAILQGDAQELIESWRVLMAQTRQAGAEPRLNGSALVRLGPALGLPFWSALSGELHCERVHFVAAAWGLAALPGLLDQIKKAPNDLVELFIHFGDTELAPIAARMFAKLKSFRSQGKLWLQRFPEHAACGLIPQALGKPGEARDNAATSLRWLAAQGHADLLDQVARRYQQTEVVTAVQNMLNEDPLERHPAKIGALPEFWVPGGWSRPVLHSGKALSNEALELLGTMLTFPTTEEVYPGLLQVKAACTATSLADFAWDCFSAWLNVGAPAKSSWAMTSLGILGNDETARKLTPYIRTWPGESAHLRAVSALDVLAGIGSDVALMLLNGIAQKVKFKGLQDKAQEKILAIAEARSLTPEELEDRLAPDLGLDQHGGMVLDFGPRAFQVSFDESLKPYVREWLGNKAGARLPDLPKPKKTDDAELAKEACERFKVLKKDARTVASQQLLRLEIAMCTRRRWSAEVFAEFLATHPLLRHLVRRLVWGVYQMPGLPTQGEDGETPLASYGGELLSCFRVSEEGAYTTAQDDPFVLPDGSQFKIGLPHALELSASVAAEFAQLFTDYELLQPFSQLSRETYALGDDEKTSNRLARWSNIKVATGKLLGLSNLGWRRGLAQDAGCIWTFAKPLGFAGWFELTFDPGLIVGMLDEYPEQTLGEVTLIPVLGQQQATFAALDAITTSELIRDMERLRT